MNFGVENCQSVMSWDFPKWDFLSIFIALKQDIMEDFAEHTKKTIFITFINYMFFSIWAIYITRQIMTDKSFNFMKTKIVKVYFK